MQKNILAPLLALLLLFSVMPSARACGNRFGVAAGLVHIDHPSQTSFEVGAEYECRFDVLLGVGGEANYVFSDPSLFLLAVPTVFLHPLLGSFYVAASPLFEFGSGGIGTHLGVRLSTRVPLPLGLFILVPSFAVDFINSQKIYWFGLGISI
jgi:hypothetical protein